MLPQTLRKQSFIKCLNFAVINPQSNVDMACAMKCVALKLAQTLGIEFRWMIRSMLEKSKPSMTNMTKMGLKIFEICVHPTCEGC
jgi:hypothetical protein